MTVIYWLIDGVWKCPGRPDITQPSGSGTTFGGNFGGSF